MPYIIREGFRIAYTDESLIVLDVKYDSYSIISNCDIEDINYLLSAVNRNQDSELASALMELNVICWSDDKLGSDVTKLNPEGYFESRGFSVVYGTKLSACTLAVAAIAVGTTLLVTRIKGLEGALALISRDGVVNRLLSCDYDVQLANDAVRKAMIFFGMTGKCLTLSLATYLMTAKTKNNINFVIGVRAKPFYSHAWLEQDGQVINDDKDLRKKMAVIMEL